MDQAGRSTATFPLDRGESEGKFSPSLSETGSYSTLPGAKRTSPRGKRTAADLREQSKRYREEARNATDLAHKRRLAKRALELAQLAEQTERDPIAAPPPGDRS
jgi:hypothetical protein